ncbi:hypothetical protein BGZ76_007943 [Entomortierella beljakovae]|nr:hypothetical protein BGZ76_007943 [Entomortierella beljakovae]
MTEQNTVQHLKRFKPSSTVFKRFRQHVYYADQTNNNVPLISSIVCGDFVQLSGPRASGKSSRIIDAMDTLNKTGYEYEVLCLESTNINLQGIDVSSLVKFWSSIGKRLKASYIPIDIKDSDGFCDFFSTRYKDWKLPVVVFFDDFDTLYHESSREACSSILSVIRRMRDEPSRGDENPNYAIHSIVTIGTYASLSWNLPVQNQLLPLLNASENIRHSGLSMGQVHELYEEFAKDRKITIEYQVISSIFSKTRGHAGLINICGVAIDESLEGLPENQSIDMAHWGKIEHSILTKMYEHGTFQRLVKDLTPSAKDVTPHGSVRKPEVLEFYRSRFLGGTQYMAVPMVLPDDRTLAGHMTALGILNQGSGDNFEIASPLVDSFIQRYVIPSVYSTAPSVDPPLRFNGTLDVWEVIQKSIECFDKGLITRAERLSYKLAEVPVYHTQHQYMSRKAEITSSISSFQYSSRAEVTAVSNQSQNVPPETEAPGSSNDSHPVPRESVYYSEMMRVLTIWLSSRYGYQITGDSYHGGITVQVMANPPVVLEILATETASNIMEHIERTAGYKKLYGAAEAWIIHFTRQKDFLDLPALTYYKAMSANVKMIHIWHDDFYNSIRTSTQDGKSMKEDRYQDNRSSKLTKGKLF